MFTQEKEKMTDKSDDFDFNKMFKGLAVAGTALLILHGIREGAVAELFPPLAYGSCVESIAPRLLKEMNQKGETFTSIKVIDIVSVDKNVNVKFASVLTKLGFIMDSGQIIVQDMPLQCYYDAADIPQ